jgi:hypothetical protein
MHGLGRWFWIGLLVLGGCQSTPTPDPEVVIINVDPARVIAAITRNHEIRIETARRFPDTETSDFKAEILSRSSDKLVLKFDRSPLNDCATGFVRLTFSASPEGLTGTHVRTLTEFVQNPGGFVEHVAPIDDAACVVGVPKFKASLQQYLNAAKVSIERRY